MVSGFDPDIDPDTIELTWEDMSIAVYGKETPDAEVAMLYTYTLNSEGEKMKSTYEYFLDADGERTELVSRVIQENTVTGEISYVNYEKFMDIEGQEKSRIDYVTSFNDDGEEVFTYYYYINATSDTLNFTVTSTNQADVSNITATDPDAVDLKDDMSITI